MTEEIALLLVDDDETFFDIFVEFISRYGNFKIFFNNNVSSAIHRLQEQHMDVIISDYILPDQDGLQFLSHVRKAFGNIPFILLTGNSKEEIAIKSINSGVDRYFIKQGEPDQLFQELAHAVKVLHKANNIKLQLTNQQASFQALFENNPISILIEDHSKVHQYLMTLKKKGISNIEEYFRKNPSELEICMKLVEFIAANAAALELNNINSIDEIKKVWLNALSESWPHDYIDQLQHIWDGDLKFEKRGFSSTTGIRELSHIIWSVAPGSENTYERVHVIGIPINERFRTIYQHSPIPIIEEDFHLVKIELDKLKAKGITDLEEYFDKNPEEAVELSKKISLIGANKASYRYIGANTISEMDTIIHDYININWRNVLSEFNAVNNNETIVIKDQSSKLDNSLKYFRIIWSVTPGYEKDYRNVCVFIFDQTTERQTINVVKKMQNNLQTQHEQLLIKKGLEEHNIRNILFNLRVNTVLLNRSKKEGKKLDQIINQFNTGLAQITNILDRNKNISFNLKDNTSRTFGSLAKNVFASFNSNIQIQIDDTCNRIEMVQDWVAVEIIYNLIDNSLKHGQTVSKISLDCEILPTEIQIHYHDNGQGIPSNEKENIFKPKSDNDQIHALFLIHRLFDSQKWRIREIGNESEGVEFVITIPDKNEKGQVNYKIL